MESYRIVLKGRVQGVNLRYMCKKKADKLGIRGYVKNLDDGNVDLTLEGSSSAINEMIEWLKNNPGLSNIENIKKTNLRICRNYRSFEIIREGNYISDKAKGVKQLGRRAFG